MKIGDVARVELGAQYYNASGEFNGKPATVLAIYQAPGANALQVAENVLKRLDSLAENFPRIWNMAFRSTPLTSSRHRLMT